MSQPRAPHQGDLEAKRALLEPQTEELLAYLKKAGSLPADFSLDGFLQELKPERNQTWLYRTLAIALLVIAFSSAVAFRLSRLSAALRASEARFRLVADNAQDVLWKYDLRQECLSYISPAVERLTGYTVEEAMSQSIDESFTAASAKAVRAAVAYLTTHPEETKSVMELESLRKDGSTVWSEATMSLIHGAHGEATEVVGVSRDVTARRQVQEQQKRFLAMVSHEFRTPMNAILGMAELLAETELTPEQRKYLEVFQNAGNTLLDLINDILDLSKVEAGQFQLYLEDFALAPILQAQVELLSPRARDKGLALNLSIAPEVPAYVHGDAQRLKQCITNLVGNALKFCHQGSIRIAVERDRQTTGMLHFSVSDTGIGIPADKLDAIFEAFNQADTHITRNYGGTGLGLTITQRLVELMAGRIWVESTPGRGSTFHFSVRLPEASQPAIPAEAPAARQTPGAIGSLSRPLVILLAEDNPNNVFLMRSLLKSTPCRIDVADNGAMAIEKYRAGAYDLILMDVEMPVMDGLTATREIRRIEQQEERRATPIFALTAHAFKEDEQKSLDAGCNGHLTKPIRKQVLLDALQALPLGMQGPAVAEAGLPVAGSADQIVAALPRNEQFDFPAALGHLEVEAELFLTVLNLFRDALPQYRAAMRQAFAAGDFAEARRQAHSLKGEAATVGARLLSAVAAELQAALDQGRTDSYAELQMRIEALIAEASQVLVDLPRDAG